MSLLHAAVLAARASGDYQLVLDALPYARFTGMLATLDGEVVRLRLPFQQSSLGGTKLPAIHGCVVGALLESAALLQVVHSLLAHEHAHVFERGSPFPKTIDFTVDYLRVARAEDLFAVAELQRKGRRIANVRMRAYQQRENEPVALGRGNFLLG